jgi:hypothetical protein
MSDKPKKEKKHEFLSLANKLAIIKYRQANPSHSYEVILAHFKLPLKAKSTVSRIWRDREKLLARAAKTPDSQISGLKREKKAQWKELDDALLMWFTDKRARHCDISGALLQQKAIELAHALDPGKAAGFKGSEGWLDRFKTRHCISFVVKHGERESNDTAGAAQWYATQLPAILKKYSKENIFNADETGLSYRLLPDGTLKLDSESVAGSKKSKDRVTLLPLTNWTGSDKPMVLMIGKSANPVCFRSRGGSGRVSLPVQYASNTKAWMTTSLFQSYVADFDDRMRRADRKVCLLVDNVSSHSVEGLSLRNVEVFFHPPNSTATTQPMDQGDSVYTQMLLPTTHDVSSDWCH